MRCARYAFLPFVFILLLPACAWANAGTPLMWAAMLHLFIGNALIGIAEGLAIGWWFRCTKWKCVLIMVIANYASAWLGGIVIAQYLLPHGSLDLTNAWRWFWIMVFATYVITLLIEWPFVAHCLRQVEDRLKKSIVATLVVQSVSYALLFGLYYPASQKSIFTNARVVPADAVELPESVLVYYVGPEENRVYVRALPGGEPDPVAAIAAFSYGEWLIVRPNESQDDTWDLVARYGPWREPELVKVLSAMHFAEVPVWKHEREEESYRSGRSYDYGPTPRLGAAAESAWDFSTWGWAGTGLSGRNTVTGKRTGIALETPFIAWRITHATLLPSDKVLFQLGRDQICVFDPVASTVTLLWRGSSPIPVIEGPSDAPH
ncbi:MAG: hypothetical protein KF858_17135 [Candidatus Sumerlaeia bacterium]|nr:hypothetical protein [Candidatus Sumerlaeia bacterium]